jgi:membrane glycosyltransferase
MREGQASVARGAPRPDRVRARPPRPAWPEARERAARYAAAWGRADAEALARRAVAAAAREAPWLRGEDAIARTFSKLRRELAGGVESAERLTALATRLWLGRAPVAGDFVATPPIARTPMASKELRASASARARRRAEVWVAAARRRRLLLLLLIAIPAVVASTLLSGAIPSVEDRIVKIPLALLFGALFGWIAFGFWVALAGAIVWLRGDAYAITRRASSGRPLEARTAIIMPICEEPVARVFAGLRATRASLERAGVADAFDFFVLSDSADPDTCAREQLVWAAWCRDSSGFGRIFYRRRDVRINRKTGNVADFLRRWGSRYRYFVVLDADSVMSGETLRRLVEILEENPGVAVVQTVPSSFGRRTPFGRITQFAASLQAPLFAAGLHFWQLGDVPYWGHNAIVRTAAFMEHAALPRPRGRPPFGGPILSHDFVEAALLGRAGFSLWLAYDLPGSFEETPATLLEEMRRDRRWCQGNLQHLRFLLEGGLFTAHRALFLNGAFAYACAVLWLSFLALGTVNALVLAVRGPVYFPAAPVLFPSWPVWHPAWLTGLVVAAGALLFVPKLLALGIVAMRGGAARFGGVLRLLASAVLEAVFAALLAPIRMMFHVRFVIGALAGRSQGWPQQERGDVATPWAVALRQHGFDTAVAGLWALAVLWLDPTYFPWLAPVLVALVLGVPVSVLSSRARAGDRLRRSGLFLTPEETAPPEEIAAVARARARADEGSSPLPGFSAAIVDPVTSGVLRSMALTRRAGRAQRAEMRGQIELALRTGPAAIAPAMARRMLGDAAALAELHDRVWTLRGPAAAAWGVAPR